MTKIAVVYHSGYGHTAAQANAVARGAKKVAGAEVLLLTSEEALKLELLRMRLFSVAQLIWAAPLPSSKRLWMRVPRCGSRKTGKTKWRLVSPLPAAKVVTN